jgi:hypothetical protein
VPEVPPGVGVSLEAVTGSIAVVVGFASGELVVLIAVDVAGVPVAGVQAVRGKAIIRKRTNPERREVFVFRTLGCFAHLLRTFIESSKYSSF